MVVQLLAMSFDSSSSHDDSQDTLGASPTSTEEVNQDIKAKQETPPTTTTESSLNDIDDPLFETTSTTATTEPSPIDDPSFEPLPPPIPPKCTPHRFLRAGKGDPVEGQRRYEATLDWRRENDIDRILTKPNPHFDLIKSNYPHYFHFRGHENEPVFYEKPPKTNLQAMRDGGVTLEELLQYYAMITEFHWQYVEKDDLAHSITILDLEGMGMFDFVGEVVDYVKRCSEFTGGHYPERAGYVLVINVPGWFRVIWDIVKPLVDEVTLEKISIISDKDEVLNTLKERIPLENIPVEYGGTSVPLGESPEEQLLKDMIAHNNAVADGDRSCGGRNANCQFCSFVPVNTGMIEVQAMLRLNKPLQEWDTSKVPKLGDRWIDNIPKREWIYSEVTQAWLVGGSKEEWEHEDDLEGDVVE